MRAGRTILAVSAVTLALALATLGPLRPLAREARQWLRGRVRGLGDAATPGLDKNRTLRSKISCDLPSKEISPLIFGVAAPSLGGPMHATAFRWGGNPTSRYNWKLHAYNTANDWYFENIDVAPWNDLLTQVSTWHPFTAITVPTLGWVAKDASSVSFPRDSFGEQAAFDPDRPHAGNGMTTQGEPIAPKSPTLTSIAASPAFVADWVRAIRAEDARLGTRRVHSYILDNEPALWSSTHRDVHPNPLTYDELVERTIAYGEAVRDADPEAIIAGPAGNVPRPVELRVAATAH